jgi:hypothetical protein
MPERWWDIESMIVKNMTKLLVKQQRKLNSSSWYRVDRTGPQTPALSLVYHSTYNAYEDPKHVEYARSPDFFVEPSCTTLERHR